MLGFWFHASEMEGRPNQIYTKGTISIIISSMDAYFINGKVIQSVFKNKNSYLNLFTHLNMVLLQVEICCIVY